MFRILKSCCKRCKKELWKELFGQSSCPSSCTDAGIIRRSPLCKGILSYNKGFCIAKESICTRILVKLFTFGLKSVSVLKVLVFEKNYLGIRKEKEVVQELLCSTKRSIVCSRQRNFSLRSLKLVEFFSKMTQKHLFLLQISSNCWKRIAEMKKVIKVLVSEIKKLCRRYLKELLYRWFLVYVVHNSYWCRYYTSNCWL